MPLFSMISLEKALFDSKWIWVEIMGEIEVGLKENNVYSEGMVMEGMMVMMIPDEDNAIDLNVWNVFDDGEMIHYQTYFHLRGLMSNNFLYLEENVNIDLCVSNGLISTWIAGWTWNFQKTIIET